MAKVKTTLIALVATVAMVSSTMAVLAQDGEGLQQDYFTATIGEPASVMEPEDYEIPGGRGIDGIRIIDVPFEASDTRISGLLSAIHNGRGGPIPGGGSRVERTSLRIVNDDGAWTGEGMDVFAARDGAPLIDLSTAWLVGDGAYDGLTAVLIDDELSGPGVHGVIYTVEPAPVPDPVLAH